MNKEIKVFINQCKLQNLVEEARNDDVQKLVVGASVARDGCILLLQRHPKEAFLAGLMELPSGTVERDESLVDALARELFEETGLICTSIEAYIGSFDYLSRSGKLTRQFNFRVGVEGELVLSAEHSSYRFVQPSAEQLQRLNVSIETQHIILSGRKEN